jgi:hypothetical protein
MEDEELSSSSDDDSSSDDSSSDDSSSERLRRKRQSYFVAFVATVFTISQAGKKKNRSGQKRRFRRQPDRLLQEAVDDGLFSREYRMTRTAFFKLCTLLDSQLAPSSKNTRGDVINVKEKVMVALRYFSGASYLDLIRKHGISKPGIYKVILQVTKAINTNPSIGKQTNFPSSTDSCETYAKGWASLSGPTRQERGLLNGCIGALDGIFIRTRCPTAKETTKARDYYSGHKKAIGLNVQALCDSQLRFMHVSIICPGKTNDLKAYELSNVKDLVDSLPPGYYH